ncbi:carboxypeptidase regulatory-like domain-containing protein [Cytophagaceae bacterium DM2B3-1]|uniref:Carboxypeptidase regulatory-like domain-containing protein n=1 Tax=Xanthocytophaga flava TaxID=3048013 RepID=A0ABT7CFY7_9BACT|nr:carboxypeptidase regulatory-like domain-containing protein [Xanthocytophaga flavus]MDJ1466660.1 carboxypeptidase regulatory-like domain-containing protein [Xanthocytophaga flavus]MDJ1492656.1 carboxypeptidase regulatory-like domain-containing protein [Xanthocytophaga flavus]
MLKRLLTLSILFLALLAGKEVVAQGITTASISGVVTDTKGEVLPGATVVAVHTPSGTQYAQITRADGRYNFPTARVGGPYTITVTFVGYKEQKQEGVQLSLGQSFTANFKLSDESTQLSEVVVSGAKDPILNSDRTGAATNIRREQFERLPSITRSFQDFSALTPQAGTNFTFGGRSNQYNNFSIDGSTSNNVFGLSALPGGQSNAQPISVDAIQEINVSVAPYDVRQGAFTGAGINAVTRSGTNEFQGSAYWFYRNESFAGKKIEGVKQPLVEFRNRNMGFRLGGPIVKNKLFFFVNVELEKRIDPAVTFPADGQSASGTPYQQTSAELNRLRDFLINTETGKDWTFDPGTFANFDAPSQSSKYLAKLDWNINQSHKLTLRYNQLNSYRDVPPSNSGGFGSSPPGGRQNSNNALPFSSSWYRINNNMLSVIAELNSSFGNKYSNTLTAGYTRFRDFREQAGGGAVPKFPTVDILGPNGQTLTTFGPDPFTPNNLLNQDVFQLNDNFSIYLKNNTVTVGTANEFFHFNNVFTQQIQGVYQFNSVSDFIENVRNQSRTSTNNNYASQYLLQYSALKDQPAPRAEWSALQLGFYAQDEYTGIKNLKLTGGIRVDIPIFPTKLDGNPVSDTMKFAGKEQILVGKLPKSTPLFSPRLGFNWDVKGDKTTQLRGGTGIFTGRIPFVWVSNQISNNGLFFGTINATSNAATPVFSPNPNANNPSPETIQSPPATFSINSTVRNFKFPQVWRSNIAIDQQLPWGLVGTLEFIYTKDLNAVYIRDANLADPVGTLVGDGRPLFGGVAGDATVIAPKDRRINDRIVQALVLDNTNKGYQWSITAQLQKNFSNGIYASAAYTYTDSRDLNSQSGSTAGGLFSGNQVVGNPNSPVLSYSSNLTPHRVIASASYRVEYLSRLATTISAIYEGRSGANFSYVYGNSPNSDGVNSNDLIYIPRNQNEIILTTTDANDKRTPTQIWEQLDAYISQDKYLNSRRGQYAQRNGAIAPWVHRLNLRLLQDVFQNIGGKRNSLQISVELINALNLINSDLGLVKNPARSSILNFVGYETTHNATPTTGRPIYTFATNSNGTPLSKSYLSGTDINSRWQLQIGLRYTFN